MGLQSTMCEKNIICVTKNMTLVQMEGIYVHFHLVLNTKLGK